MATDPRRNRRKKKRARQRERTWVRRREQRRDAQWERFKLMLLGPFYIVDRIPALAPLFDKALWVQPPAPIAYTDGLGTNSNEGDHAKRKALLHSE